MTEMVLDMIRFLQKWGLWQETMILADGNAYKSSRNNEDCFQGIPYVKVKEKVDPDEYIGKLGEPSPHIFDMTFDSALTEIFNYHEMEPDRSAISPEAWKHIFEHSRILEDFIAGYGNKELLEEMISVCDREYTLWDPLEYESFEEYAAEHAGGSEQATPVFTLFDNDEEYRNFLKGEPVNLRENPELWDMAVRYGIRCFRDWDDSILIRGEVIEHILNELNAIFEKYGLWYEPEESRMLVGRKVGC